MAPAKHVWTAFAELEFEESAHLAVERALEAVGGESLPGDPNAWVIADRKIALDARGEGSKALVERLRAVLEVLVQSALAGEVVLDCVGLGRYAQRVGGRTLVDSGTAPSTDVEHDRPTLPHARRTG